MAIIASMALSPDEMHTLGKGLIPAGIVIAVYGIFIAMPTSPYTGLGAVAWGIALTLIGLRLKKKYCPRCREGQCELPTKHDLSGTTEDRDSN
jgi:hypothetical protein